MLILSPAFVIAQTQVGGGGGPGVPVDHNHPGDRYDTKRNLGITVKIDGPTDQQKVAGTGSEMTVRIEVHWNQHNAVDQQALWMEAQLEEAKLKIGGEEIALPFSIGPATFGDSPLYAYEARIRWQTNHFSNGLKQIEFIPKVKVWRTNPGLIDGNGNVIQEPFAEDEATYTLPVILNVNVQNVALVNATQICDAEVACPVPGTPEYVLSAPNQAAVGVADARTKLSSALYDVIANDQHYESAILEGTDPLLKNPRFSSHTHTGSYIRRILSGIHGQMR